MNLDDETYLSAFLDDELDPADRLAVEWSVESSPPMAEQLRRLALARDAVAGLGRPAIPRDLALGLSARVVADLRRARLRAFARSSIAVSSFATIAASLILAIILLNRSLHETTPHSTIAIRVEPAPAPRTHPIRPSDPSPSPAPTEIVRADPVPSPAVAVVADPRPIPPVVSRDSGDRPRIARMLQRPHVRRIVIVADVFDDASAKVRNMILQDARKDPEFGRISIVETIAVDPDWAEPAEVFAVPMDERGRRSFVDRLTREFPGLVEEGQTRPGLVAQLAQVGRVDVFRGVEAAPLGDPPRDLLPIIAHRPGMPPDHIVDAELGQPRSPEPPSTAGARVQEPGSLAKKTEADPEFIGPPDLDRMAPPRPGELMTVLVWVTRPAHRREFFR